LNFGFELITFEQHELVSSNVVMARDPRMEHGGVNVIDKNQNPRWPAASIFDFGLQLITLERLELDTSNLAHG